MVYLSFQYNDAKSEATPCLPLFAKQDEVLFKCNLLTLHCMEMGFNENKISYNLPKYCWFYIVLLLFTELSSSGNQISTGWILSFG